MKTALLSIAEIENRYHDQWVLVVNPVYDKTHRMRKGNVLCHSENREKIDKVMLETKENKIAIKYLGTLDKDLSTIL